MVHVSMVEKLRKQAKVSYEDAKEALEMTEWDMLDAYVWLEAQGKLNTVMEEEQPSQQEQQPEAAAEAHQEPVEEAGEEKKACPTENCFKRLVRALTDNFLVARSNSGKVRRINLLGVLGLMLFFRKLTLLVFVVSLCMLVNYSFEGPLFGKKQQARE